MGGNKITRYENDPLLERRLQSEAQHKGLKMPSPGSYSKAGHGDRFATAAGTGVDIRLNRALAFRPARIEWAGKSYRQGPQLSTGVILRIGTW